MRPDAELRRRLGEPPPRTARRTGVEHEFRVRRGSQVVDFRSLIGRVDVAGRRIVADDPMGQRCRGGFLVTADGAEAEIASAPVPLRPGFTDALLGEADRARARLAAACGPERALEGWSTHLNVEVDRARARAVAQLVADRYAPALMLLMDGPSSPGLLVRPRSARLEIGGEFVTGDGLRAAAVMAAGAALTCERATSERHARRRLPRRHGGGIVPATMRYGHYIDRRAFGTDLYEHGRTTDLRTGPLRRTRSAQEHLRACWESVLPDLIGVVSPEELALTGAVIGGDLPLPLEGGLVHAPVVADEQPVTGADPMDPVERAAWRLVPTVVTWDMAAYEVRDRRPRSDRLPRSVVVSVPAAQVADFHRAAREGRLDDVLTDALDEAPTGRVLDSVDQTGSIGVFDRVGDPGGLTAEELDPTTGRPFGAGGGRAGRRAKRESESADAPRAKPIRRARRLIRTPVLAAVAGVVVVAGLAVGGYALASGGDADSGGTEQADGGADQTDASSGSSTTRATTTTTLPDTEPARPTPAQKRDATLDGTFTLRSTVSKSDNITAPVGKSYTSTLTVTGACAEAPCDLQMSVGESGKTWAFDGRTYRLHEEFTAGCFGDDGETLDPEGALAVQDYTLSPSLVARRDGQLVVTELRGTGFLTARPNPASAECGTSNDIRPVSYDLVATPAG